MPGLLLPELGVLLLLPKRSLLEELALFHPNREVAQLVSIYAEVELKFFTPTPTLLIRKDGFVGTSSQPKTLKLQRLWRKLEILRCTEAVLVQVFL
ncbi:hypothetical protein H6F86_23485 [Phormidium sp. FACHB-592]|uniref:Uncharacterized protein n=1 Tax=Stenomitos frigidus AS-A4 TaxID=2933935 RepID=A0ABV0KTW3_9CYAN|nr:hypothetical protein [Phormidium sp. FACHB-592]MBD2076795.1 hypothetical protein [Phormidium sp. FACHB-592]